MNEIEENKIKESLLFELRWWFSRHRKEDGCRCKECLYAIYELTEKLYKGREVGIG